MAVEFTPVVTPVERHGDVMVKRDDLWSIGGASGAKVRAIAEIACSATGIISAGSRISPQLERAALAAQALGIPARLHTGAGRPTSETLTAARAGAEIIRHNPARLTVIRARFRADVARLTDAGWVALPWGMEHPVYLRQVAAEAASLPLGQFRRIVMPVGSGMTLAAVLRGLPRPVPVIGVRVGADPTPILDRHAPGWRTRPVTLVTSALPYEVAAPNVLHSSGLRVDPHYEAKCLPYLDPEDLLWCVGIRASATHPQPPRRPSRI